MKVLYLGYAINADSANTLVGASVAGNKMQLNILKELNEYSDIDLHCITVYPTAPWPRRKQLWVNKEEIQITDGVAAVKIPFLNIPLVKQVWQSCAAYHAAKKLADDKTVVLSFNLLPQTGLPLLWLKKKYGCKTYAILADPPMDDNPLGRNALASLVRKIFYGISEKSLRNCDSFIVLNREMMKRYGLNQKYIVVEGGISTAEISALPQIEKKRKNLVYSGALTEYSGILELIHAMDYVKDKDAVLEIYGGGYLEEKIKQLASERENVRFCGKVSNQEIMKIQQSAWLLVNPRRIQDPIAQVTFPSKMFEYMLSGTPTLGTKLSGYTEEYLEHIYCTEDDSALGFAEKINELLATDQAVLQEKANRAREFIKTNKNWMKQCEKIHDFLREV